MLLRFIVSLAIVSLSPSSAFGQQPSGIPTSPLTASADESGGRAPLSLSPPERPSTASTELAALERLVESTQHTVSAEIPATEQTDMPPPEITVEPGRNEVIPIARGHLNRLVTPFATPTIKTTSDAVTNIEGSILYVATEDRRPITLYVMDVDAPELAMSLTLLPREIPPVQVTLFLSGKQPPRPKAPKEAIAWETGQPYVETIKHLFRALALGQVPPGYGLTPMPTAHALMPRCKIPGIDVRPAQVLEGGSIITFVARAVNATIDPIEIDESGCSAKGVLAVAAWPNALLEPGGETEIYIAVRRPDGYQDAQARPSVLRSKGR